MDKLLLDPVDLKSGNYGLAVYQGVMHDFLVHELWEFRALGVLMRVPKGLGHYYHPKP